MNVVFLDFDGVLNTGKYKAHLRKQGLPGRDEYGHLFDPKAVEALRTILRMSLDTRIVIESSWKVQGLSFLRQMWKARNLPGEIYDMTPDITLDDLMGVNLSDPDAFQRFEGAQKAAEIRAWLRGRDCHYIIIDDVAKLPGEMALHHIKVDPEDGLTSIKAVRALNALLFL